jgi:protein-S-isoprenylcysteine O-methyltransferase Ste14
MSQILFTLFLCIETRLLRPDQAKQAHALKPRRRTAGAGSVAPSRSVCEFPCLRRPLWLNESVSGDFIQRGGAWVIAQCVLMALAIGLGVVSHGDWTQAAVVVPGFALFLAGGAVGIAGVWALGRNRSPFPRPREDSQFIQRGIYASVRHPLYLSVMLVTLGWAMIWQSWLSFFAALSLIPLLRAKARREEAWLREKFPDYARYEQRVPGFLPRLSKW